MTHFLHRVLAAGIALLTALPLAAQNRTVTGTVTDARSGEPLVGVTVTIQGTTLGATTGLDGVYTLQFPADLAGGGILHFNYLGYNPIQETIGSRTAVDVQLAEEARSLDAVVVIGYGTATKKELTGSVASLGSDDMNTGSFTSAAGLLQGKVAGLTVTNPSGGDPAASFEIMLRGTNTLAAGQGPLVIIDGVVGADIRNINFQEVENIDVLKDGSAAAIYGTRGTNGVVIITTKRASKGSTSLEYDGQVSVQTVLNRAKPMSAREFEHTINNYAPSNAGSLYGYDTDWFDEITRTPISHKHSVALSGGSEKFSHRTILNVEQNQGLQRRNTANKYMFKTNIRQSVLDGWLDLDYNAFYTRRDAQPANYDAFRQAFFHNPTEPVYDPANKEAGGYSRIVGMDYFNPVAMVSERTENNTSDDFGANVRASLNILPVKGLKWDNFFAYNMQRYESRSYSTRYYPSLIGTDGRASIYNSYSNDIQWESTLNYIRTFGKHNLQALLGYTYQWGMNQYAEMANEGFDNDLFGTNNIGAGSALQQGTASMGSHKEANKYIAFFGRVMYNYDDRYLVSASLRRDGSSRFGTDHKWGWFPAVSVGWRLSNESFLRDAEWLDELKIRAGYGVTGNQDFDNYRSLLLMRAKGYFYNNGKWQSTYSPKSNANPGLGWEKKAEWNVGIDFSFFRGRLSGAVDYYSRRTTDLLYEYDVPVPPYDYNVYFTNVGEVRNQGVEVTLSGIPVVTRDFRWTTTLTLAHNTNKLVKFTNEEFKNQEYKIGWLNTPVGVYCQRLIEGQSLGAFYGPVWEGVDPETGKDILKNSIAGSVAESKWEYLGSAYPDVTLGWSNNFTYRNWELGFTLRASVGGKVFNNMRAEFENINGIGLRNIMASWLDDPTFTGQVTYSSKYLEDASYLKLDNISLGYSIPFKPTSKIKRLKLYFAAQNLFCLTGYSGVDPEVSLMGLTPGIESPRYYPRTREFTFGMNLKF
ncbi:TonB-dependent receptor [uncultured Alistipes sp.]|uniref:SusC/RagA family TonB-linked outer membrane protein n=1 Tax=uncultured Alistipes sp. TaxID=538949 RepID=UPI0025A94336|nr:TonB-dependent receptor [uncultured Alistipes sp.]